MRGIETIVIATADFLNESPIGNMIMQVVGIMIIVLVMAFVLTMVIPVLFIVILLIAKYLVPISITIYAFLANILNL